MKIKQLLRQEFQKHPFIKLVILFGSIARGDDNVDSDSDIDIAVAAKIPLTIEDKTALIERITLLSGRPVDLIDLQLSQEPIFSKAISTGELIYCKDRNLYAELIKRMWFNQSDFIPLRNRILEERRKAWISKS